MESTIPIQLLLFQLENRFKIYWQILITLNGENTLSSFAVCCLPVYSNRIGGTHISNSEEAKHFVILSENGIASGIRRIFAVTHDGARKALEAGKLFKVFLVFLFLLVDSN